MAEAPEKQTGRGRTRTSKTQQVAKVKLADAKPKFSRSIAAATPASHFRISFEDIDFSSSSNQKLNKPAVVPSSPAIEIDTINRVIKEVPEPESSKLSSLSIFGENGFEEIDQEHEWKIVKEHLLREGRLDKQSALSLIDRTIEHLEQLPNLLELEAPITICGDIHGQFFDLVNLLERTGDPRDVKYLFLGDYVDRGDFSTEVCFLLFSIMLTYPNTFFMLRGNHESRLLTTNFNFRLECFVKYDEDVYEAFMDCFDCLPIAARLVTKQGVYFACHGGLSPHLAMIDDIQRVDRMIEPPGEGLLCDLLWSDPAPEEETLTMAPGELKEWKRLTYRKNSTRGCSFEFGYAAVDKFVQQNNIKAIIRAHEVKRMGYEEHYFRNSGLEIAPVITVFSAPNYCDMYENKAGFLELTSLGECRFGQITWASHPYWLPNFEDAFAFSLPFVAECATSIYLNLLQMLGVEESQAKPLQNAYSQLVRGKKQREKRITWAKQVLLKGKDPFAASLRLDQGNERRPRPNRFVLRRANSTVW